MAPALAVESAAPPDMTANGAAPPEGAVRPVGYVDAPPPGPPQPQAAGYLQAGPVFRGAELPPLYPPTATEHAVELRRTIDQLSAENQALRDKIDGLEAESARQAELLRQAEDELASARDELAAARAEISRWNAETKELESELEHSRGSQDEAMRGVMERLETILRVHRQRPLEINSEQSKEDGEGQESSRGEEIPPIPAAP